MIPQPTNEDAINAMAKQVNDKYTHKQFDEHFVSESGELTNPQLKGIIGGVDFGTGKDYSVDSVVTHKQWIDNEYSQWVDALHASTVGNFKEHPMVQRMLSEDVDPQLFPMVMHLQHILLPIDNIGRTTPKPVSGACLRMAYYALKVIEANPTSIVEIGGGVGQFYVILRALGWEGSYAIKDLPGVREFQDKYITKASEVFGIPMSTNSIFPTDFDFVCSFYALGEFDDETKQYYFDHIKNIPHGLILWNPHSGATPKIPIDCTITDEYPKTGNTDVKELSW